MNIAIDTDVYLRELQPEDASDLFSLIDKNRVFLGAWLLWVNETLTEQQSREFILSRRDSNAAGTSLALGLFKNDILCGTVGFVSLDSATKSGVLGYWIAEEYQGQGLVYKACIQLLKFGFHSLLLDTVFIRAISENIRSVRLLQRLGFVCHDEEYEEQYYRGKIQVVQMTKGFISRENWLILESEDS